MSSNVEQFRRYLKRMEIDGTIVLKPEACRAIIMRCETWIFDTRMHMSQRVNSFTFDEWAQQQETLDELFELCKQYRAKVG